MTDDEMKFFLLGKILRRNLMARVKEQWEVLFEGTVTTTDAWWGLHGARSDGDSISPGKILFTGGDTVRLTVNGVEHQYAVTAHGAIRQLGNTWLTVSASSSTVEDDGTDFAMQEGDSISAIFYSRNPGTYAVKIERKVS